MYQKEREEWLASLNIGDEVAMDISGYGHQNWTIVKITKITPTRRMESSNGYKLGNDGIEMGKINSWTRRKRIYPLTDEIVYEVRRKALISKIERVDFKSFDNEKLEKIYNVIIS